MGLRVSVGVGVAAFVALGEAVRVTEGATVAGPVGGGVCVAPRALVGCGVEEGTTLGGSLVGGRVAVGSGVRVAPSAVGLTLGDAVGISVTVAWGVAVTSPNVTTSCAS